MANQNVDLVLVIDSSSSMDPCFNQLRMHLRELIKPLQGYAAKIRFGIVALSATDADDGYIYQVTTLVGGPESVEKLYRDTAQQFGFFSENVDHVLQVLDSVSVSGNEDNLTALDIALDFPFGKASSTKRIVALFSDEPLEDGVDGGEHIEKIPEIIEKIHARRVKLFFAVPYSEGALKLSEANGSELEVVDGGAGLSKVDFKTLLAQMGKSISVSSLQSTTEAPYQRALFGQDGWESVVGGWRDADS